MQQKDLLKFLEALLNVGHRMSYIVEGAQKGLGWEVDREWMGAFAKASATRGAAVFGKTGFTGTSILCDVEKGRRLVSPEQAARFAKAFGHPPAVLVQLSLQDSVRAGGLKLKVSVEAA